MARRADLSDAAIDACMAEFFFAAESLGGGRGGLSSDDAASAGGMSSGVAHFYAEIADFLRFFSSPCDLSAVTTLTGKTFQIPDNCPRAPLVPCDQFHLIAAFSSAFVLNPFLTACALFRRIP